MTDVLDAIWESLELEDQIAASTAVVQASESFVFKGTYDQNKIRTQLVIGNTKYKSLSFVQLKSDDSRCFGVNENNTELMLLLNRGLRVIGSSF